MCARGPGVRRPSASGLWEARLDAVPKAWYPAATSARVRHATLQARHTSPRALRRRRRVSTSRTGGSNAATQQRSNTAPARTNRGQFDKPFDACAHWLFSTCCMINVQPTALAPDCVSFDPRPACRDCSGHTASDVNLTTCHLSLPSSTATPPFPCAVSLTVYNKIRAEPPTEGQRRDTL